MAIMPNACAMRRRIQGLSVNFAAMPQHRVMNAPSNMLHALRLLNLRGLSWSLPCCLLRPKVAELSAPRSLVVVPLRP
jgi:hypothetical protein